MRKLKEGSRIRRGVNFFFGGQDSLEGVREEVSEGVQNHGACETFMTEWALNQKSSF